MKFEESDHKKEDDLYWTKKYFSNQKFLKKTSGNKKPNNFKITILISFLILTVLISTYFYRKYSNSLFIKNSKVIEAIIYAYRPTKKSESFAYLESHLYKYYYCLDGITYYSFDIVDEKEYNNCITKNYQTGDTILIRYLEKYPTKSKIKCD